MLDASAFVGVWPFRNYPERMADQVIGALREVGFKGACFSPVEAILAPEPMAANRQLLQDLRDDGDTHFFTVVAPIIDPSQAVWAEHAEEMIETGSDRVRAFKIAPNYHAYSLEHPGADALAEALVTRNLALCIQLRMEDERSRHALMSTTGVPAQDVAAFAARHPRLRVLVCAAYMGELKVLAACPNVSAELSMVESGRLLRDALAHMGSERLLAGTHAPLFVPEVGACKPLSDEVDPEAAELMCEGNFMRVFQVGA